MKSVVRGSLICLVALLGFAVGGSCGTPKNTTVKDAGGITTCRMDTDCSTDGTSVCKAGACRPNTCSKDADCSGSQTCSLLTGQCVAGDGGVRDGGTDGGPGDGGTMCTTKADCDFDLTCKSGACTSPPMPPTKCFSDDQCGRGQICNIDGTCDTGCDHDTDCMDPQICNVGAAQCQACGAMNLCPAGKICESNACVTAPSCSTSSDCNTTSAGTVCDGGTCGNCVVLADCSGTPYGGSYTCGRNGLCAVPTCTDQMCQMSASNNPLEYCDMTTSPPQCTLGQCNGNGDCTGSGQTCNTFTHTCVGGTTDGGMNTDAGSGCGSSCDSTCQGQNAAFQCDPIGCGCTSNNAACGSDSDCTSEEACEGFFSVCAKVCSHNSECPAGEECCSDFPFTLNSLCSTVLCSGGTP